MRRLLSTVGIVLVAACSWVAPAYALSYTCPKCHQTWPFDPRDTKYCREWGQWHTSQCQAGGNTSSVPSAGSGGSPSDEAMLQAAGQLGQLLGQSLRQALESRSSGTGAVSAQPWAGPDPRAQARAAELGRQRAAENDALFREMQDRILKALRMAGAADVPTDLEGKDDGLRPRGTAIFGLGGGDGGRPEEGWNDPMVVDLRHLRQAGYLAQAAETAGPSDAPIFLDQAVLAATGGPGFSDAPAGITMGADDGLLAFQKQNAEYRKARDSNLILTERFQEAQKRREQVAREMGTRRQDLEQAMAAKMDKATLEEKHRMLSEVLAARKAQDEAWLRAKAESVSAQGREGFERAMTLTQVRAIAVPSVARPPAEILREERERIQPRLEERMSHHHPVSGWLRSAMDEGADRRFGEAYGFVDDPAKQAKLERTVDRLRGASGYPDDEIRVRILDLPKDPTKEGGMEGNVAAVGNTIYVGRKYLERTPAPSDDELAFVLGHEMGHIHKDHAIQTLGPITKASVFSENGEVDLEGTQLTPRQRTWVETQAKNASWLGEWKRPQESEADRYGANLALATGAKPGGMRQAYQWMQEGEDAHRRRRPAPGERKLDELTRDHPEPRDRFEDLRRIYGRSLGDPLPE